MDWGRLLGFSPGFAVSCRITVFQISMRVNGALSSLEPSSGTHTDCSLVSAYASPSQKLKGSRVGTYWLLYPLSEVLNGGGVGYIP